MSKIYINDTGQGFPLVLVHGYLGSSEMWCLQRDYLSKFFRVISPALPGFGESHEAQSLDSINDMANFVINIINEKLLDKNGVIIIHRHRNEKDFFPKNFTIIEEKIYGISKIIFLTCLN